MSTDYTIASAVIFTYESTDNTIRYLLKKYVKMSANYTIAIRGRFYIKSTDNMECFPLHKVSHESEFWPCDWSPPVLFRFLHLHAILWPTQVRLSQKKEKNRT